MRICERCGHTNMTDTAFCENCGNKFNTAAASGADSDVCVKCGRPILPNDSFCQYCGTPVVKYSAPADVISGSNNFTVKGANTVKNVKRCGSCGAILRGDDTFCPACGQRVGVVAESAVSTVKQADKKEKSGKGLVAVIVALAIVLVSIIGVICYFVFFKDADTEESETKKSKKATTEVSEFEPTSSVEPETVLTTVAPETTTRPPETTVAPAPETTTATQLKYYVNTNKNDLNIRTGPGKEYSKIENISIPKGTQVDIDLSSKTYNSNDNYTWVRVNYKGQTGWIAFDLLEAR